jgi:hypothetical protein
MAGDHTGCMRSERRDKDEFEFTGEDCIELAQFIVQQRTLL